MRIVLVIIIISILISSDICAEEKGTLWNFKVSLGLNIDKGNTDKIGGSSSIGLERDSSINAVIFKANGFYGETEGEKDTNKGDVTFMYDHKLWERETLFLFLIPSYNQFQNLKYRIQSGVGYKHTFYKTGNGDYSLSGAVLYEKNQFFSVNKPDDLTRLSFRPKMKYSFNESGTLFLVLFYQPKLNEFQDYRILSEFVFEFKILEFLSFEFKIGNEYNNFVPAGTERNDFSLVNALTVKL